MALPYLKYNNDRFQRLGFIKVLVSILDPQRRSVNSDSLARKIESLLFDGPKSTLSKADELIRTDACPSWNQRFGTHVAEILDWARLLGVMGSGNQITERGLTLRYLMGSDAIESFRSGSFTINPFHLSVHERLYFLFRYFEIDAPLLFLIKRLSELIPTEPITGVAADKQTFFSLLDAWRQGTGSSGTALLSVKDLREILGRMAAELGLLDQIPFRPVVTPPRPSTSRAKPEQRGKKRTKTADHQAIPRFELLVDLGCLDKRARTPEDIEKARTSWKYWPTELGIAMSGQLPSSYETAFTKSGFARAAATYVGSGRKPNGVELARRIHAAYLEVQRKIGHTPLETVAIVTMIRGAADGCVIELADVHALFLDIKAGKIPTSTVHFAAGNDLDRMFIEIEPNFLTEVEPSWPMTSTLQ